MLINVFFTLAVMLFSSGCIPEEKNRPEIYLLPGETATRTDSFCFYIGTEGKAKDQKILNIPSSIMSELVADPVWTMPQGLSVKTSTINILPYIVSWEADSMKYTAPGAAMVIDYEVTADKSAVAGKGEISIIFENLNLLKGDNIFYIQKNVGSGCFSSPKANPDSEAWKLNDVVVFANADEKGSATTKSNVNYVLAGIIGGVIIFALMALASWARRS